MGLGRFTNPSASDISSGLVPAPPPIKQSDVTAVRTNYGIAADFKPKGQTDSSLYDHSVKFVLDWWKRNNPATATGTPPPGGGSGGTGGTTGGSGSGGSSGSGGMPDTATGTGGPAGGLAHIQTPQEVQAQALGTQRGAVTATKADPIVVLPPTPANPVPVSKATATSIMLQMGLRGVTPPTAAMKSTSALRSWATAELAKQKLAQARGALTAKKAGV